MKTYICIDIGGTNIKYGLINESATILESHETPTEGHLGGPHILQKVLQLVEDYVSCKSYAGICISTAGVVDCESGQIIQAADTIPNFCGTPFKKAMEERFHLPCQVENDVNCAALAEYHAGAARGSHSCLCLTIGTGIGGAMVENGKIYHGFSYSGCEVGYMHMLGSTFQDLGSSSVLVKKVQAIKGDTQGSIIDGKYIFQKAKEGDEDCIRAIQEMCDVLGMGIANLCFILNPETVVLGGGIMAQQDYLYEKIRSSMDHYLIDFLKERTALAFAQNRNQAGMLGAFFHFRSMHSKPQP